MRERGRGLRDDDAAIRPMVTRRPQPNRLSDEATPNVLTGTGEGAASNVLPSWVRGAAAQRVAAQRAAAQQAAAQRAAAQPTPGSRSRGGPASAPGADRAATAQSGPSWFSLLIIGFIILSILRACLQLG